MSSGDQQGGPDRPDYKVYRSRRGPSLPKPGLPSFGKRGSSSGKPRDPGEPGAPNGPEQAGDGSSRTPRRRRPWLRWILLGLAGWLLLSVVAFGVSAQIQKSKLADTGGKLGGNPLLVAFPQNILILGTDVRSDEFASSDAQDDRCVDAAASGATAPDGCVAGRADTIMILRAGGGAFEKLSIPRDAYAEIPGHDDQKINAAYAFGGAELQVETVEQFLGIEINHVAIVDFGGFRDFINAIGGIEIEMPRPVCNEISGGTYKINLRGKETLNGDTALALARSRESTCGHGIDDIDRARFQQLILQGIKDRMTNPLRIPRNFLFGPLIAWNAPKAFVSDMGALTLPQLALAAAIGGSSDSSVLQPSGLGPGGSLLISSRNCAKGIKNLTGERPDERPPCSPTAG